MCRCDVAVMVASLTYFLLIFLRFFLSISECLTFRIPAYIFLGLCVVVYSIQQQEQKQNKKQNSRVASELDETTKA